MSPAFPVKYPVVINQELIADHYLGAMEVSWARGKCPPRPAHVFRLRNVYVIRDGLVFDSDLRFVENASPAAADHDIQGMVRVIAAKIAAGAVERVAEPTVIVRRTAPQNYGHYLLEMFPVAVVAKAVFADLDPAYLVARVNPPMQDVMFRTLRLAGIALDRVRLQDDADPVFFEEALSIQGLTEHGVYMSPASVQAACSIAQPIGAAAHKKIFILRTGPAGMDRPLLNQKEVADRLGARGFTVVDPRNLSVEQQIAIFKGAECVVGVSGAAMTNIVFCQPGTSIVSLVPACFPDTFFWFIATHRKLEFMEIRGDQPDYEGESSWNRGFTVREEDIRFLEGLTKDTVPGLVRLAAQVGNQTLVHVENAGDLRSAGSRWAGRVGSGRWIEGVSIRPPEDVLPEGVAFQVLGYDGQASEWAEGGGFAGTRGEGLPVLGFRLHLRGSAAARYTCFYEASFVDGTRSRLCLAGELCAGPDMAPLEALKVEFIPRPAIG